MRTARVIVIFAALGVAASVSAQQGDAADERARALFVTRQYPDALAIYARLYSETRHPTYLRNMGRCHQMMQQPDQAIANFRAYLREAHDLAPTERSEIEGYIAEMQQLQLTPPGGVSPPGMLLGASPAPSTDGDRTPVTRRVWFWTGLGILALGAVIAGVALGTGHSRRLPCPPETLCPP